MDDNDINGISLSSAFNPKDGKTILKNRIWLGFSDHGANDINKITLISALTWTWLAILGHEA
jgi:hypothetical protein